MWTRTAHCYSRSAASPEPSIERAPPFSDDWIALTFTQRHANDLRYCAEWGRWLIWDGTRWRVDNTKQIVDFARKVCREVAIEYYNEQCDEKKSSKALASSKTVAAVKVLAEADRRHATTTDQWDADPWLLNTPDGTVDLRAGAMRPHSPDDYITRITAVAPGGECPTWMAFLDRVTDGNKELQAYLQRVVGYALTGMTTEHALFFFWGTGSNGKSVFINTIGGILGEFQKTAPIETFTASLTERHPTDLAGLRGARLVTSMETEEGRPWAETKIKLLTGGDKIPARFMRQDFFEYTPHFKLVIAGNNKPSLRSVDEAMRRRFNLIPFTVTIQPEERDPKLSEKLKEEWPGILQWMIEGCLEWQRIGLAPPKAVTDATSAYLAAEDAVTAWIEEYCERNPDTFEPRPKLLASWKAWADKMGEDARSAKWLYEKLEARDRIFPAIRHGVRGYKGLRILEAWGG